MRRDNIVICARVRFYCNVSMKINSLPVPLSLSMNYNGRAVNVVLHMKR